MFLSSAHKKKNTVLTAHPHGQPPKHHAGGHAVNAPSVMRARRCLSVGLGALLACLTAFGAAFSSAQSTLLPTVPDGAQAVSLTGEALYAADAGEQTLANLAAAKAEYQVNPDDADAIVWLGRRMAYAGDYRGAIQVFSEGIDKFPEDPRFYRHRGHRYISIREFDRAIADFQRAVVLMQGMALRTEPDGLPNAENIPLTTTQGNVWYHLGLAYYLKQDWPLALAAFRNGYNLGGYDDNLVSTGHWIYMILRRMGREEEAAAALSEIHPDMRIIENMSYHQLCLLYKGEMEIADMMAANGDDPSNAAVAYGIANWYYYNGNKARSDVMLQRLVSGSSWSAFGYIAAEADLANPDR